MGGGWMLTRANELAEKCGRPININERLKKHTRWRQVDIAAEIICMN
jgi:hypothetical protein